MYSGLIPINMTDTSRALFFVFQPSVGAPVNEITIWLNGGPGMFATFGILFLLIDVAQAAAHLKDSFRKMGDSYGLLAKLLQQSIPIRGSGKQETFPKPKPSVSGWAHTLV